MQVWDAIHSSINSNVLQAICHAAIQVRQFEKPMEYTLQYLAIQPNLCGDSFEGNITMRQP
jgi:hypothetical protein